MAYRASAIRSIQRGSIALSTIQASNTATITAVTTTNSVVSATVKVDGNPNDQASVAVVLTNSTTVTASRITGAGVAATVEYTVTEYWPGILKSVQPFTISMTAGVSSNTATITAVVTAKSVIVPNGATHTLTNLTPADVYTRLVLTNTTTVTGDRGTTTGATVAYGTVVEWK